MIALVKEAHRPADPIRCHIPPGRIAHGTIWWIFHTVFCRIQRAVIEILTKKGQAFPAYRQRPSASRAADIVHTSERHPQGMCRKTADHSTMTQSRTSCSSAGRMLLSASPLYSPDGCLQGRKKEPCCAMPTCNSSNPQAFIARYALAWASSRWCPIGSVSGRDISRPGA